MPKAQAKCLHICQAGRGRHGVVFWKDGQFAPPRIRNLPGDFRRGRGFRLGLFQSHNDGGYLGILR